jgi:hypothetical protein
MAQNMAQSVSVDYVKIWSMKVVIYEIDVKSETPNSINLFAIMNMNGANKPSVSTTKMAATATKLRSCHLNTTLYT